MTNFRASKCAALCFGLIVAVLCTSEKSSAQEMPRLNIGIIMPLSGPQKAFGEEAIRGIEVAAAQFAEASPKIAKKIKMAKFDDKSKSKIAGEIAKKLYGKKRMHVVIGSISSSSTQEIALVAAEHKRPLVSPLAASANLIEKGYVYRTGMNKDLQASILGQFVKQNLRNRRVAILRDDSETSASFARRFTKSFRTKSGKIVANEIYSMGTTDFRELLMRIKSKKAQSILLPAYSATAGLVMQQAQELGLKAKFLGNDSWDTPSLNKAAGAAGNGHYFTAQFTESGATELKTKFITAFRAKYGRSPGVIAALAYDSYFLTVDALRRARSTLHTPFNRAFQRTAGFQGVTGLLSFNSKGELLKTAFIKQTSAVSSKFHSIVRPDGIVARIEDPKK